VGTLLVEMVVAEAVSTNKVLTLMMVMNLEIADRKVEHWDTQRDEFHQRQMEES